MSASPPSAPPEPDWEEQEVDFRRHWDALLLRWWLPLLGLVAGAIVGYALSLGGSQVYKATATVYLGQPYSASGNIQLQNAQTNPSTVRQIVSSRSTRNRVAAACKDTGLKATSMRGNIAVAGVSGNLARLGQTPEVTITVQLAKALRAACAANQLARVVVSNPQVAGYANAKIENFRQQVITDEREIAAITGALNSQGLTATEQLLLQLQLRNAQADRLSNAQLLSQARQVEAPKVLSQAAAEKVTARSRRNSVVVAAFAGLVIGLVLALLWEPIASRFGTRRPPV
jgi:hypothetical protein